MSTKKSGKGEKAKNRKAKKEKPMEPMSDQEKDQGFDDHGGTMVALLPAPADTEKDSAEPTEPAASTEQATTGQNVDGVVETQEIIDASFTIVDQSQDDQAQVDQTDDQSQADQEANQEQHSSLYGVDFCETEKHYLSLCTRELVLQEELKEIRKDKKKTGEQLSALRCLPNLTFRWDIEAKKAQAKADHSQADAAADQSDSDQSDQIDSDQADQSQIDDADKVDHSDADQSQADDQADDTDQADTDQPKVDQAQEDDAQAS